jgi:resuscitation-promoting factor RpfB
MNVSLLAFIGFAVAAITSPLQTDDRSLGVMTLGPCDPNYAGACVPIAVDVDCSGGRGDGPAYVEGPVRVIGVDVYGLDRDGDGWGCEKSTT